MMGFAALNPSYDSPLMTQMGIDPVIHGHGRNAPILPMHP
jgi:hypothetical protein